MKWYGAHADLFEKLVNEKTRSTSLEFFLILIGEEGNNMEVVHYVNGGKKTSEMKLLDLQTFTGMPQKELNNLDDHVAESWMDAYVQYQICIMKDTLKHLKCTNLIISSVRGKC